MWKWFEDILDVISPSYKEKPIPPTFVGHRYFFYTSEGNPWSQAMAIAKVKEIETGTDGEQWVKYSILLPNGQDGIFKNEIMKLRAFRNCYEKEYFG